ncbi:MAG: S9 family peptidase [candidate division KSB1 bacterium]|nr:S9 family peptidase [candidate division KSB1 bacterium]MDZ7345236.1 S9 family peptidase [candidate division KSB1 bacterium]
MRMLISFFLLVSLSAASLPAKRPMTVEDLWAMKRIGRIELSPDGSRMVYEMTAYDMEKNSGRTDLWLLDTATGETRQLTTHAAGSSTPHWKPDGSAVAFLSSRNCSRQIFLLPLSGGEAVQLTRLPLDIEDFAWSPDGKHLALILSIFPKAANIEESAAMERVREESLVKAHIADRLLFRPWNHWRDGRRSHLFLCNADGANLRDLTPGDWDVPPLDLGGDPDFCFSPDGKTIAFVGNATAEPAVNTNNDVFLLDLESGIQQNLTAANAAVDNQPVFSPDGRYLAYRAMRRPGFEADEYELMLYDRRTGSSVSLTDSFDRSVGQVIWSPDNSALFFTAEDFGRESIYRLELKSGRITKIIGDHVNRHLTISPNGRRLFFKRQSAVMPEEIFGYDLRNKSPTQLTFTNQPLLDQLDLTPLEDLSYPSFDGKTVHGFLLKPPAFDTSRKYPLLCLIHGGPQGMWGDDFHYRWNTSLFASRGFVVVALNIRGSKGYGQEWCDAVSRDWGGGPYQDILAGIDYVVERYSFIDKERIAAAGASYGGYMINWIATQTDRFKALVSHAGVFDLVSKYGATDELWFPEWEFGGIPYENPDLYRRWSPSTYAANLNKFRTPTLVIHGELDFRVPVTQGLQMFTALQRYGVPSKLICFPDETHFVTKPQNARLWWNEVFAWLEKWLAKTSE